MASAMAGLTAMQSEALRYLAACGSLPLHGGGYHLRTWWSLHRRGLVTVKGHSVHAAPGSRRALEG